MRAFIFKSHVVKVAIVLASVGALALWGPGCAPKATRLDISAVGSFSATVQRGR